jgi:hypothetical protein
LYGLIGDAPADVKAAAQAVATQRSGGFYDYVHPATDVASSGNDNDDYDVRCCFVAEA